MILGYRGWFIVNKKAEIIFMQVRLVRLASEKWHKTIGEIAILFKETGVYKFIEDCYDIFCCEGDNAIFEEGARLVSRDGNKR